MNRTMIFAAGFFIIALIALQMNTSNISSTEETEETVVFQGLDLTCTGCEEQLTTAMDKMIGIINYQTDPNANALTVTFETHNTRAEWIKNSLEAAGFTVKDMEKVKR